MFIQYIKKNELDENWENIEPENDNVKKHLRQS